MNLKHVYLTAAIFGAVVPYIFFTRFILDNGLALSMFIDELFATQPATGFSSDLLITSVVFWIFLIPEARLRGVKHAWIFILANLTVGLSLAFPLFLYFRRRAIEQSAAPARS